MQGHGETDGTASQAAHPKPGQREPGRPVTLADAGLGQAVRVTGVLAGRAMARRLGDLGLKPETEGTVVHRNPGGGVVIATGGIRIAVGAGMAGKVLVESVTAEPSPPAPAASAAEE